MSATQTCLSCMHYGIVRIIEEEEGLTFEQICRELPGVSENVVRENLIELCSQRILSAMHFGEERKKPLHYYTTPKGLMMLRQFENECEQQKPKSKKDSDSIWAVVAGMLALCLLVAYSSCAR